MEIRKIENKDVKEVILIHNMAFKNFFLTGLGKFFLSIYYRSVLNNEQGILLGCYEGEDLLGFCAGTILSQGFNKRLIKSNFYAFIIVGIYLIFTKPSTLIRLFRNFSKTNSKIVDNGLYAELLSIGVNPDYQNNGVGKILLKGLESTVLKMNEKKISLTTDCYNNEKAISFYKACGYYVWYDFMAYPKRKMYRMIKQLSN